MDWLIGLQKAIDYLEDNLSEEIDYSAVAARAYSSSFYFQRIFSLLTGMTMGEYIRNRRLTLAGTELAMSKTKVIDVALKYCYDSPESFAKAFNRFHGITPLAAREPGAKLKSFGRLSIKLTVEGGCFMNYRIEAKEAFHVIGKSKMFSTEGNVNNTEIPRFWSDCYSDGTIDILCRLAKPQQLVAGPGLLGICDGDSCPGNGTSFQYAIGTEGSSNVPDGFDVMEIPAATWAIFQCTGAMPDAIQDLWKQIYSEFFAQSGYRPAAGVDFEYYPQGDNSKPDYVSEIWLPVIKES